MLIVGKSEAVRNTTLFVIRHLIEPTGYLKTSIMENGNIIIVLKDSLRQWLDSSPSQESRRNEILENISDDLTARTSPQKKKSSYIGAR